MNKTIVKVECHINESGAVVPKSITWHDGRKWDIARVVHSCASYDGEFEGIRYTVLIGSAEKYLYRLGSQWYVDSGYELADKLGKDLYGELAGRKQLFQRFDL